jgi:hypothetical protein
MFRSTSAGFPTSYGIETACPASYHSGQRKQEVLKMSEKNAVKDKAIFVFDDGPADRFGSARDVQGFSRGKQGWG